MFPLSRAIPTVAGCLSFITNSFLCVRANGTPICFNEIAEIAYLGKKNFLKGAQVR